jgi:acetyl-CoA carboxylase biotin carboxyl carrier protein
MDLDQLKQILTLVREHELAEFEIEQDGLRLWVRKDAAVVLASATATAPAGPAAVQTGASGPATQQAPPAPTAVATADAGEAEIELAVVKSPIVGTFYRSAEPGAPPFVEVGSTVKKGQVLCIIEAMKLMNEIDSEYDGEVVNVYVESGQPVQYAERLFAIRTSDQRLATND